MKQFLKISQTLEIYKRNNALRLQRIKEKENINLTETLVSCYKRVPSNFFDQKYLFNFEYLNRDKNKMSNIQEDVII